MPIVLILSSQTGAGHATNARALTEILHQSHPHITTQILNISPRVYGIGYRLLHKYFPTQYRMSHQLTDNPLTSSLIHQMNRLTLTPRIYNAMVQNRPSVVITNNSLTSVAAQSATDSLTPPPAHFILITDPFTLHHLWTTNRSATGYLVPTPETAQTLSRRGIPPGKIHHTGFLLRPSIFQSNLTPKQARRQLKLFPDRTTLFIGGSGEGLPHLPQLFQQLNRFSSPKPLQLIINCGNNTLLYRQIKLMISQSPHPILLTGFVPEIHKHLIASDLIIGKPGPNLLFEAIALKKPFIATEPPLGQEIGNYHYLQSHSLGFIALTPDSVVNTLTQVINHPDTLRPVKQRLKLERSQLEHTPQKIINLLTPYLNHP